jgi:hypothetical protein
MKTIVYSAIYGDYDQPKAQPLKEKPILFTDTSESTDWEVRKVFREEEHPRMKAKYFKCMPHQVLDCDVSIWIDGTAIIKTPYFVDWCLEQLGDNDIALFKHPFRDCIYDEGNFCCNMPKYSNVPIIPQIMEYLRRGHPRKGGLWACGLLIRRHNDKVKKFNKLWWSHNKKYTYQDQLSFPVCVREAELRIGTIDMPQYDNDIIDFNSLHKNDL